LTARFEGFVKYLIINGDDFGASRGINRAILELYELGVLTSTSLMIGMPATADAVRLAKDAAGLGVGLHVTLTEEDGAALLDFDDAARCSEAIEVQIDAFSAALDRLPTHLDAHQNVQRDPRLTAAFKRAASNYRLPLREHSPVRYFSSFYGQWDGVTHPEQIGIDNLLAMLKTELRDGVTELSCHPGYAGADFASSYDGERELELQTLSDPRLREFVRDNAVKLISFGDVEAVMKPVLGA
jgi:predicted glycoside hydrolase/deacetylase ChbG (UPF0249 family)